MLRLPLSLIYAISTYLRMQQGIHPPYHPVVFWDTMSDFKFLTRSTQTSNEQITWEDGKTYPLIKTEISAHSHPFYTGEKVHVDTQGRIERFRKRYQKTS